MPNVNEMIERKYLSKEDVDCNGRGMLVTIAAVRQENLAKENERPNLKWCLHFREAKPLALNVTNTKLLEMLLGSANSDHWIGRQIVLYNDKTVQYQGRFGGVRVRLPNTALPQPMPVPQAVSAPQGMPVSPMPYSQPVPPSQPIPPAQPMSPIQPQPAFRPPDDIPF